MTEENGHHAIADAVRELARAIDRLGTNNASTPMGAIELLASEVKRIADNMEVHRDDS
jgi:HAMP domain-containing protein